MHTIWIVPGRFGLTFGPQQTGSLKELSQTTSVVTILRKVGTKVYNWHQRSRQRQHLADLDDALLKDIGLSHDQQRAEIAKRFWEK